MSSIEISNYKIVKSKEEIEERTKILEFIKRSHEKLDALLDQTALESYVRNASVLILLFVINKQVIENSDVIGEYFFRDLLTQIGEELNVQKLKTIGENILNLQSDIFEEADKAKARRGYQCHAERLEDCS